MVSRQETARPLLTPGEVMQLPNDDELVLVSGCPPIRAKKARYYEDSEMKARILPPPTLSGRDVPSGPEGVQIALKATGLTPSWRRRQRRGRGSCKRRNQTRAGAPRA